MTCRRPSPRRPITTNLPAKDVFLYNNMPRKKLCRSVNRHRPRRPNGTFLCLHQISDWLCWNFRPGLRPPRVPPQHAPEPWPSLCPHFEPPNCLPTEKRSSDALADANPAPRTPTPSAKTAVVLSARRSMTPVCSLTSQLFESLPTGGFRRDCGPRAKAHALTSGLVARHPQGRSGSGGMISF